MAYGLQIQGSHGVTQVDQDYTNLCLIDRGTVSWDANVIQTLSLSTLSSPLLAIRTDTPVLIFSNNNIGTTSYFLSSTSSGSGTYYLFDRATTTNGEPWGLAIYNSAGALTFHSSWKILRIGAIGQVPNGSLNGDGTPIGSTSLSISAPYSATWAAVACSVRYRSFLVNGQQAMLAFEAVSCNDSAATLTVMGRLLAGQDVRDQPNGGALMMIDVTGY